MIGNNFRYITEGEPSKPAPDLNGNNDNATTANANGNNIVQKLAQNLSNVSCWYFLIFCIKYLGSTFYDFLL